jgi:adenylate cyclase
VAVLRKLAAIGAADVSSHFRLVEADWEGTFARFRNLRRNLIDPKIVPRKGRAPRTTGAVQTPIPAG